MINEEKVKLMTKLAILEESLGSGHFRISSFYYSDYIGIELMKTFLLTTIGYGLCGGGLFLLYTQKVSVLGAKELERVAFLLIIGYIFVLFVYLLITYFCALGKYKKASRFMEKYQKEYEILEKGYSFSDNVKMTTGERE